MKTNLRLLARLSVLLLISSTLLAQSPNMARNNFGRVTGTGPLGVYISYRDQNGPPSNYSVDWSFRGTAAIACTFQLEGSSNAVDWYPLTDVVSCTSGNMLHVTHKPVDYLRVNILSYTAGDPSTSVSVRYVQGRN